MLITYDQALASIDQTELELRIDQAFGHWIAERRQEKQLIAARAAVRSGIKLSRLMAIEGGRGRGVTRTECLRLAHAYGLDAQLVAKIAACGNY